VGASEVRVPCGLAQQLGKVRQRGRSHRPLTANGSPPGAHAREIQPSAFMVAPESAGSLRRQRPKSSPPFLAECRELTGIAVVAGRALGSMDRHGPRCALVAARRTGPTANRSDRRLGAAVVRATRVASGRAATVLVWAASGTVSALAWRRRAHGGRDGRREGPPVEGFVITSWWLKPALPPHPRRCTVRLPLPANGLAGRDAPR
jgi:hypothetical protein